LATKKVNDSVAFILAGGASSRMGRAKALLEISGEPMIMRTARLLESVTGSATAVIGRFEGRGDMKGFEDRRAAGPGATLKSQNPTLGLRVIEDDVPGAGPLEAIATALRVSDAPWNLIVACDLPYLTREWLEFLVARAGESQADAVIPMNARGAEPLCAVYHKCGEPLIRTALERGVRKVTEGLKYLRVEAIPLAEWKAFDSNELLLKNMNSPEDYEEAKARLEGRPRATHD